MTKFIDFRSDTVTQPTALMRTAMAEAELGDDVYGEDPTINLLERTAANLFKREAALFLPSGSMGNLIGLKLHTHAGQEVICEAHSHVVDWEMGMMAAFAGCIPRTIIGEKGTLTWDKIHKAISPKVYYRAQTGLIWLENSHNMAGGTVTPLPALEDIWAGAKDLGLPTHLDGARVFNAAVALGVDVAELTSGFDTVMFCLSKGLGAPVGSMLIGSREAMDRARSYRKALGGGMRQAGMLAAAGLLALTEIEARLSIDHDNALLLANGLARCPSTTIDLDTVQTNIVMCEVPNAEHLVASLRTHGILAGALGPKLVRFVTHCDVTRDDCDCSLEVLRSLLRSPPRLVMKDTLK